MKPENLLDAFTDISGSFIADARIQPSVRRATPRRFTVLIAAVIALMALAVTAFAAGEIAGWFKQYFTNQSDVPLTPGQIEFIEENEQVVEESQEQNGWTVELKSVLADSQNVYVIVGVTAPADVTWEQLAQLSGIGIDIYDGNKKPCAIFDIQVCDDSDEIGNTAELVISFTPADWNGSPEWTVRVDALIMNVYNKEYEQELLDTKYAGQENIMFTDEEAAKIYQQVTLAEGPWELTFDLSNADNAELELITDPVSTLTCYGYKPDGTEVLEEVQITSFVLRPLGATASAESIGSLDLTYTTNRQIYAVMSDGSRIQLFPSWGSMGQQHFDAESPIVLDEVDHVLLPDGTKLMVP